jgi:hypothetical protein
MASGAQIFQIDIDLIGHEVLVLTTRGDLRRTTLTARPVAEFYRDFMTALDSLGIEVEISPRLPPRSLTRSRSRRIRSTVPTTRPG